MSTDTTEATEATNEEQPNPAQETTEIDWKAEARKWEGRAKENKTAADRLAELENQLNEVKENYSQEVAAKETALEKANLEVLRFKIATQKGITDQEDIDLFLTGTDEETLEKQAQRLIERTSVNAPKPDPAQGKRSGAGAPIDNADAFAAALGEIL